MRKHVDINVSSYKFSRAPPRYSFSPSDGNINDLTGVPCPPTGDEAGQNQYRDFKYFHAVYIKIPRNRLPPLPTLTKTVDSCKKLPFPLPALFLFN